jgi:hypothetical protein
MKKNFKLFIIMFCLPNFAISQIMVGQQKYVYNNYKDTIQFSRFKTKDKEIGNNPSFGFCDEPKIIDSIQIDGIGRKEIVFYRFCRFTNSQHGGSFDIDEKIEIGKYEIWNLDTKTLIFEAIDYIKNKFNRFRAGMEQSKGTEFYKYDLKIDSNGVITIKNSKQNASNFTLKPDKEEGVYRFINGDYLKM